jgi:perosamine synthetase
VIPVSRPLLDESDIDAITETARQGWISGEGPVIAGLEEALKAIIGVEHAIAVSSGTSACDLLSEVAGVGPGDEVVAPAFTIIATVSHAVRRGASLRLVDADPLTWCMPAAETVEKFNDRTKVVLPVHIYGLPVDMDPIMEAAESRGILVFEDAAEAIGLEYKDRNCGSLGHASALSFYANKTVTGGEGGAILTRDPDLAVHLRSLRNLCFIPEERFIHHELGFNARMPSLVAALVRSQLQRLPALIDRKRAMGARYQSGLAGHPWLQLPLAATEAASNSYWVFGVVSLPDAPIGAQGLREKLNEKGIDSRRFFMPLNKQPVLRERQAVTDEPMPVAEMLWERGIYLPCGMGTTIDEIDQTVEALWKIAR